jgi:ATP-dependent RNA helicase DHX8/PRP22
MSSADLAKLEEARLVSLVVDASGVNDKDFAEFIIDLAHTQARSRAEFVTKLLEIDDSLGAAFAEKLYTVIMTNTPQSKLQQLARAHSVSAGAATAAALSGTVKAEPTRDEGPSKGALRDPTRAAEFPALALKDGVRSRDWERGDGASFTGLRPDDDKYERGSSGGRAPAPGYGNSGGSRYNDDRDRDRGGVGSGSGSGGRDRSDRDGHSRPNMFTNFGDEPIPDTVPRLYSVYEAEVVKVGDYNATLHLLGFGSAARGPPEALLPAAGVRHTGSNAAASGPAGGLSGGTLGEGGKVELRSLLRQRQRVWVKVLSEQGGRYSVSMRDVDQATGRDLRPIQRPSDGGGSSNSSGGNNNGRWGPQQQQQQQVPARPAADAAAPPRARRVTSPERWQSQLLAASGVLGSGDELRRQAEYEREQRAATGPSYAAPPSALRGVEHVDRGTVAAQRAGAGGAGAGDEDIDIELNEEEPAFLRGQLAATLALRGGAASGPSADGEDASLSAVGTGADAVKIVRMPHGSMQHAAVTQAAMAKARRSAHEEQRQQLADSVPTDLGRSWADPMAESGDRILAIDLKGLAAGQAASAENANLPEWKREMLSKNLTYGKVTSLPMKEQREGLPIFALRGALLEAVRDNQILVVIGETGSGKTTQMTQYLAEAGYTSGRKIIGCTQPRRVAATSIAKRVADEVGCKVGAEVGYCVRFEDCTSADTVIRYMTDGMLLRELLVSPDLNRYSVIMLDEAHERTINTDVLFGLLKSTLRRRPDLKLIVTSATLDADKFSAYFGGAPIFTIPGRMFPVTIHHMQESQDDYLEAALLTVLEIHISQPPGDILLFLTGKEEIDTACEVLYDRLKALGRNVPPLEVLPVYSTLPSELQSKIFEPAARGSRKCVVATNIAEASLTIDGIFYVVDPGFCKVKAYDAKLGMDSLVIAPISQASANQRAGRAGRTGPGRCYRLYTKEAFQTELMPSTVPEIQRTNLGNVVLMLKAMGINDMLGFDFMDPPPAATMLTALHSLFALGALDEDGLLTRLGRKMAEFPLEPQLSKILISSVDLECSEELLTVVAMLAIEDIFYRPRDKQAQADAKRARFFQSEGDHLTLLAVYDAWMQSKMSAAWCQENFVTARSLRSAQDVRKQLVSIMERYRLPVVSCGRHVHRVCRAICSGYFMHAAKKDPQEGYKTLVESQPVYIHPSSSLYSKQPEWLIYHKLVLTTKEYLHQCLAIDPKWLVELAPNFFRKCDENQISRRKKRERLEPLFDKFHAPNEWRLSRRKG